MQITPISEHEEQRAALIPKGIYPFYIEKAATKISRKSQDMLSLTLLVRVPGGLTRKIYDNIVSDASNDFWQRKLRHFFYSINCVEQYESGYINIDSLIGCTGMVLIGEQEPRDGFGWRNVVTDYLIPEGDKTSKDNLTIKAHEVAVEATPNFDDDLPF